MRENGIGQSLPRSEDLRLLRAQDALDSGRVPSSKPTPPTDV